MWKNDIMFLLAILLILLFMSMAGKADLKAVQVTYQHVIEIDERKAELMLRRPIGGCPGQQWIAHGDFEINDYTCVKADLRKR